MTDTPTPARPALDAMVDLELEAACERYWNERFADGWSWTEMSAGVAGNTPRQCEIGLEQATDIRRAISAAINPIRTERDAALRSLADMRGAATVPPQTLLETACRAALGCLDDPTGGTHVDDMRAAANHLRRGLADLTSPTAKERGSDA